ncbi:hypothetical protein ACFWBV_34125 [Streptomyces sp. NPDC060030]|uniref:hypothetical protein n=1 Tax=Streptomyces sp. NPDC060030 TaxID=3347042 RepID=UPI0036C4964C
MAFVPYEGGGLRLRAVQHEGGVVDAGCDGCGGPVLAVERLANVGEVRGDGPCAQNGADAAGGAACLCGWVQ